MYLARLDPSPDVHTHDGCAEVGHAPELNDLAIPVTSLELRPRSTNLAARGIQRRRAAHITQDRVRGASQKPAVLGKVRAKRAMGKWHFGQESRFRRGVALAHFLQ